MTVRVPAVQAIVTDIEGTTTSISFVKAVLFPYAAAHLRDFVHLHAADPEVAAVLEETAALSGLNATDVDALCDTLVAWMERDLKHQPLKTLQGLIWEDGYRTGHLRGEIFGDVTAALRAWRADGFRLAVYSSGSVLAQRLLFSSTPAGDLSSCFERFFDTAVGGKKETASYRKIAAELALKPQEIVFLSDVAEELDAAAAAGLKTVQVVRVQDGTIASDRHPSVPSLSELMPGRPDAVRPRTPLIALPADGE